METVIIFTTVMLIIILLATEVTIDNPLPSAQRTAESKCQH
ncbi:MAG: hypothetical protein ACJASU_000790 [Cognaticolwellia sp.]|jgi:hypothetical protein